MKCRIDSNQAEVEMGMDLTHQRTSLVVVCDVPLLDPEVGGGLWGRGEQEMGEVQGEGKRRQRQTMVIIHKYSILQHTLGRHVKHIATYIHTYMQSGTTCCIPQHQHTHCPIGVDCLYIG